MSQAYYTNLERIARNGTTATIDRDGAPSIKGRIIGPTPQGCIILNREDSTETFIAIENIRGISELVRDKILDTV